MSEEVGHYGTSATLAWCKQAHKGLTEREYEDNADAMLSSINDPCEVVFLGEKAKVGCLWERCALKIQRWRIKGNALVVYGFEQGVKFERDGESQFLRYWKAYFPARHCAVLVKKMVHEHGYTRLRDEDMSLSVRFPMWLKAIKAYPCRADVVLGENKDGTLELDKDESPGDSHKLDLSNIQDAQVQAYGRLTTYSESDKLEEEAY